MKGIGVADIFRSAGPLPLKAVKLADHLLGCLIAGSLSRRKRQEKSVPRAALRFLVIRPGGMGDAVFLLPVMRELKRMGHAVDVLCERRNLQVFVSQEGLCRRVFCYDAWPQLRDVLGQAYDVVVDTEQWHHASAIVAYFIRSRWTIGFATRPARAQLFDAPVAYDHDDYELKCFARLFEAFGVSSTLQLKGSYQVSPFDAAWAKAAAAGPYVAIALGGSIALRRFTSAQVQGLCQKALSRGYGVVLLGGHDVAALAQDLAASFKDERVTNFAGRASLPQSAALIAGAKRFIGHDSGLLHIAVALGIPASAVFGPGHKEKWGPQGAQDAVIHSGLACSPCTRFGYTLMTCQGKARCIREDISVETIF